MRCISKNEAYAEKFRAALSRREVAARDFFDIDYAVQHIGLQPQNEAFIMLVRQKMAVRGNTPVDVSVARHTALRQQINSQLRPVLREKDFAKFNVDRAFDIVAKMAVHIQ